MFKIELPNLEFEPDKVEANKQKIDAFLASLKGARTMAEGLQKANQAFCKHEGRVPIYDPGYGGGGFSHNHCPKCGSNDC